MELITKSFAVTKSEEFDNDGIVSAYITTWNNEDKVGDIITEKALDQWLEEFDPSEKKLPMLYSHRAENLIGEWTHVEKDDYGLKATGVIYTETTQGRDIHALIKRDALKGASIGFIGLEAENLQSGGRKFNKIHLVETSIVMNPCNPSAEILSVKSEDGLINVKQLKEVLRDHGLNRKEIDCLFNEGWGGLKNLRKSAEGDAEITKAIETLKSFKL